MKKKQKSKYKRNFGRIIINTFIGMFGIVIFLLIISFGFMQTSTFRLWLKNKIITTVDSSINGTINISNIEGTILTSLYINNISVSTGADTIFTAKKVGVTLNTFNILIGQISVKKFLLEKPVVRLNETSKNNWNYENLFKKDDEKRVEQVTENNESENPFNLIIKSISIQNLTFDKKKLQYKEESRKYDTINYDDIEISNFNLEASLLADFNKSNFILAVKSMSAEPNLNNFKLINLQGMFEANTNYFKAENVNVHTDSSNVNLFLTMDRLNIFSNPELWDLKNCPVNISLTAAPFAFTDITSFTESTNILNGKINAAVVGSGLLGNITVSELIAEFLSTQIKIKGKLLNLFTDDNLFIDASVINSKAQYKDVLKLLPDLDLPDFNNFKVDNFNSTFKGEPTKFKVVGLAKIDSGKVIFDTYLNLQPKSIIYDSKLTTTNLNASPFINVATMLNGNIKIKGTGTSPSDLNSNLNISLQNSLFIDNFIDSVNISARAVSNIIDLNLEGVINNSISNLNGSLDYSDRENPLYNFTGKLNNFNLELFTNNTNLKSNLNFNFYAKGKYLDIDKTIGEFNVDLDSSTFKGQSIYGSNIKLELKKDSTARIINLFSNFADIYINGEYLITDLTNLLAYQEEILSSIFSSKIAEFNPRVREDYNSKMIDSVSSIVNKNIQLKYNLNFKDYSLIQILLQNDEFNILGSIQGNLHNDSTHFEISSELNLDRLVNVKNKQLMFISGIDADINLSRDNQTNSFNNIIGALTFSGQRMYVGSDFHNVNLDLTFNDSLLFYDASADISEDLTTLVSGDIQLKKNDQKISVDTLEINYKKIPWQNKGKIIIDVNQDSLIANNFNVYLQNSLMNISGFITDSLQNVKISLTKLPLNILNYYLTGDSEDSLLAYVNLSAQLTGNIQNPVIDVSGSTTDIVIDNYSVGAVNCKLNYSNKSVLTDIEYVSLNNASEPFLKLFGTIPIDLTFEPIENRVPADKQIDLHLKSNNFDMETFGNILPVITGQSAKLETDVDISGDINNPQINGIVNIRQGEAKLRATNLKYNFDGKINISDGKVIFSEIKLSNSEKSKYKGKMNASGNIEFESAKLKSMSFEVDGELAVLSNATKDVNPTLFGDLVIKTNGPLTLTYSAEKGRYLLAGDVKLKNANLIYTSPHSGFTGNQSGLNYIYVIDSSKIDSRELDFMKLIAKIKSQNADEKQGSIEDEFDYQIKLSTDNDAVFTVNLAKELGQKIKSNLHGSIVIDKSNGKSDAQGSFHLLEGSKMEFFKTLSATGEIKFEKNLLDPYLDITADYISDYVAPNDPFGKSQEVAVKIKLNGPLSKLGEKLSLNDENFAVYVGRKNIDSNIPDNNYDISDALVFILFGKFKNDLISNQSANNSKGSATSTAASYVISPILSSLLNSTLGGGVIDDIQISQSGQYYRVGISGKFQNLRYRIGGTTEALSDIAKANILVQYFINSDLSIRMERRYPIIYSEGTDERVNEFGMRYKFEF